MRAGTTPESAVAVATYRLREGVPSRSVVSEHVHRRAPGSEEDGVARLGEPGRRLDHAVHDVPACWVLSLRSPDVYRGDLRRVSAQRLGDELPVPAEQHHAAEPA